MLRVVKDHPNLLKDMHTGLILNTDAKALQEYKDKKAVMNANRENKNKIDSLEEKVNSIQGDLEEIKNLIKGLMSK